MGRDTCRSELAREGLVPASGDVAAVPASSRASALLPGIFGVDYSACKQVSREESKTLKSTSDRLCRRRRSALARDLPGTGSKTGKCVISDKPRRLIHDGFAADRGQATLLQGLGGADGFGNGRDTCGSELAREGLVPASGDVAAVPASSRQARSYTGACCQSGQSGMSSLPCGRSKVRLPRLYPIRGGLISAITAAGEGASKTMKSAWQPGVSP